MESSPAVRSGPAEGNSVRQFASGLLNLRVLGLITVLATYGLIVLGGVVRATDSGTTGRSATDRSFRRRRPKC